MSLRGRIFIIITLGILAILGITVALIWRSNSKNSPPLSAGTISAPEESSVVSPGGPAAIPGIPSSPTQPAAPLPAPTDPVAIEKAGVPQLAKVFIERYNSYSTDNDWQNIKAVETLVTPSLWKRLSSKIGAPQNGQFVGVATNVITAKLTNWAPPQASVEISFRQITETGGKQEASYRSVIVTLIKNGDAWRVDSFVWGQ